MGFGHVSLCILGVLFIHTFCVATQSTSLVINAATETLEYKTLDETIWARPFSTILTAETIDLADETIYLKKTTQEEIQNSYTIRFTANGLQLIMQDITVSVMETPVYFLLYKEDAENLMEELSFLNPVVNQSILPPYPCSQNLLHNQEINICSFPYDGKVTSKDSRCNADTTGPHQITSNCNCPMGMNITAGSFEIFNAIVTTPNITVITGGATKIGTIANPAVLNVTGGFIDITAQRLEIGGATIIADTMDAVVNANSGPEEVVDIQNSDFFVTGLLQITNYFERPTSAVLPSAALQETEINAGHFSISSTVKCGSMTASTRNCVALEIERFTCTGNCTLHGIVQESTHGTGVAFIESNTFSGDDIQITGEISNPINGSYTNIAQNNIGIFTGAAASLLNFAGSSTVKMTGRACQAITTQGPLEIDNSTLMLEGDVHYNTNCLHSNVKALDIYQINTTDSDITLDAVVTDIPASTVTALFTGDLRTLTIFSGDSTLTLKGTVDAPGRAGTFTGVIIENDFYPASILEITGIVTGGTSVNGVSANLMTEELRFLKKITGYVTNDEPNSSIQGVALIGTIIENLEVESTVIGNNTVLQDIKGIICVNSDFANANFTANTTEGTSGGIGIAFSIAELSGSTELFSTVTSGTRAIQFEAGGNMDMLTELIMTGIFHGTCNDFQDGCGIFLPMNTFTVSGPISIMSNHFITITESELSGTNVTLNTIEDILLSDTDVTANAGEISMDGSEKVVILDGDIMCTDAMTITSIGGEVAVGGSLLNANTIVATGLMARINNATMTSMGGTKITGTGEGVRIEDFTFDGLSLDVNGIDPAIGILFNGTIDLTFEDKVNLTGSQIRFQSAMLQLIGDEATDLFLVNPDVVIETNLIFDMGDSTVEFFSSVSGPGTLIMNDSGSASVIFHDSLNLHSAEFDVANVTMKDGAELVYRLNFPEPNSSNYLCGRIDCNTGRADLQNIRNDGNCSSLHILAGTYINSTSIDIGPADLTLSGGVVRLRDNVSSNNLTIDATDIFLDINGITIETNASQLYSAPSFTIASAITLFNVISENGDIEFQCDIETLGSVINQPTITIDGNSLFPAGYNFKGNYNVTKPLSTCIVHGDFEHSIEMSPQTVLLGIGTFEKLVLREAEVRPDTVGDVQRMNVSELIIDANSDLIMVLQDPTYSKIEIGETSGSGLLLVDIRGEDGLMGEQQYFLVDYPGSNTIFLANTSGSVLVTNDRYTIEGVDYYVSFDEEPDQALGMPTGWFSINMIPSPSVTPSVSFSSTLAPTFSSTPAPSTSESISPAESNLATPTISGSSAVSASPIVSPFISLLASASLSASLVPSASLSASLSPSLSPSPLIPPSLVRSASLSVPPSPSPSASPSPLVIPSPLPSPSESVRGAGPAPPSIDLPSPSQLPPVVIAEPSTSPSATRTILTIPGVMVPIVAPSGADIIVTPADENIISSSDTNSVRSNIVNVQLADPNDEIGGDVEICFETNDTSDDLCLGFLDETLSPPEWKCEDPCLESDNGFLCGTTSHFTNFALLLGGAGGGSDCGSSNAEVYITGGWFSDFILVLSCMLAALVCVICVCILITVFPPLASLFFGKEGNRIRRTRHITTRVRSESTRVV